VVAASRVGATYAARVSLPTGTGLPMLLRRLRTALCAQVNTDPFLSHAGLPMAGLLPLTHLILP
jgi:hypothetical protein